MLPNKVLNSLFEVGFNSATSFVLTFVLCENILRFDANMQAAATAKMKLNLDSVTIIRFQSNKFLLVFINFVLLLTKTTTVPFEM